MSRSPAGGAPPEQQPSAQGGAVPDSLSGPKLEICQEIRFAIVMYGGVSLACYINGASQELFNLVRATAPELDPNGDRTEFGLGKLTSTQSVYRKLGQILNRSGTDYSKPPVEQDAIRTRFRIDIISGSSAGGINGIFLAKGLVNNQAIAHVKKLWIEHGDFDALLNDNQAGSRPRGDKKPAALLSGRYLYDKLLAALQEMDKRPAPPDKASPNADELDLYITTTDIHGLTLPIELADRTVHEKRHRKAFHFAYRQERGPQDFVQAQNPVLAFAARCTSSFPFAFEPMKWADVPDKNAEALSSEYSRFFTEYPSTKNGAALGDDITLASRPFGDGGYLDNKPFSHAIAALQGRRADVPLVRKLFYIEPAPEHPENDKVPEPEIDFLQNVQAAVLNLPRYETIREDLNRVLERNRLIERIANFTEGIEEDLVQRYGDNLPPPSDWKNWGNKDLHEMILAKGVAFGGYHRLKVGALTDELADVLGKALDSPTNFGPGEIRERIRDWRAKNYTRYRAPEDAATAPTENTFLVYFDLNYRLRRFLFLRNRHGVLSSLREDAQNLVKTVLSLYGNKLVLSWPGQRNVEAKLRLLVQPNQAVAQASLLQDLEALASQESKILDDPRWAQVSLSPRLKQLRSGGEGEAGVREQAESSLQALAAQLTRFELPLPERVAQDPLAPENTEFRAGFSQELARLGAAAEAALSQLLRYQARWFEDLQALLDEAREPDRGRGTGKLTRSLPTIAELEGPMRTFGDRIRAKIDEAIDPFKNILHEPHGAEDEPSDRELGELTARAAICHYYEYYDDYDFVLFPITYQTDVGELAKVDVYRISPEESVYQRTKAKLAGTALANFGAFLNGTWRANDILWGRLDAADRLIRALLPDKAAEALRVELIREAQEAILHEDLSPADQSALTGHLARTLIETSAGRELDARLTALRAELERALPGSSRMDSLLRSCLAKEELLEYFRSDYEVDRGYDPTQVLRLSSRSTHIVGQMLEGLAERYRVKSAPLAWISRFGLIFWGVVEAGVPQSLWNRLARNFLGLIYLLELILFIGATLFVSAPIQQLALAAVGCTLAFHLALVLIGELIAGKRSWLAFMRYVLAGTAAGLLLLGALSFWDILQGVTTRNQVRAEWRIPLAAGGVLLLFAVAHVVAYFKKRWIGLRKVWQELLVKIDTDHGWFVPRTPVASTPTSNHDHASPGDNGEQV